MELLSNTFPIQFVKFMKTQAKVRDFSTPQVQFDINMIAKHSHIQTSQHTRCPGLYIPIIWTQIKV